MREYINTKTAASVQVSDDITISGEHWQQVNAAEEPELEKSAEERNEAEEPETEEPVKEQPAAPPDKPKAKTPKPPAAKEKKDANGVKA